MIFDETIVQILGNSPLNTPIKSIRADVQDYNSTCENNGFKWKCNKLMFINNDNDKKLIHENEYLSIDNKIYRIIKVDNFGHLEAYLSEMNYITITLNDSEEEKKAILQEVTEKISYFAEKIMISNFEVNTGDLVKHEGANWLITSMIGRDNDLYRCRITKVEQSFKMYIDKVLYTIPCIVEVQGSQQIQDGQFVNVPIGGVKLTIQDNSITKKIEIDDRLIKMNNSWKVEGFTTERAGLRYLYLKKDQFTQDDNRELEIADYYEYNPKISITCDDITVNVGSSVKLNYKVYENDEYKADIVPAFESLNESICTVDENGNVTGVGEGQSNIKLSYRDFSMNVNVEVSNVINVEITGRDYIKWGLSTSYTINNEVDSWTIENKDTSQTAKLAEITKEDNNSCTVKANSDMESGYIILKAIKDNQTIAEREIRIKSIYF